MKKIIKITLINIVLFCLFFILFDYLTYKKALISFKKVYPNQKVVFKYSLISKKPNIIVYPELFFKGKSKYLGRLPDGLEYKDKKPIIVFGCSYAYGDFLNQNQTFTYKLAHLIKHPVYNRAAVGWSIQHMLFQTETEMLYEDIKDTDNVIFIMISDHMRRLYLEHYYSVDSWEYLHYTIKNNKPVLDNYDNIFVNFLKSIHLRKIYNHNKAAKAAITSQKETYKIHDDISKYIIESRNNIEKHLGKKINFTVIYYEPGEWGIPYKYYLTDILEKEGINVISTKDLTSENLRTEKYFMLDNGHPKETAWDLLTPLIAERLHLKD
ncbi:hypothetical protein IJ182_07825 [bacterium]|nr:hypothetical protein [bacterium]